MTRPNYWGNPPNYPEGTPGHETSDHYKPARLRDHVWSAIMAVLLGGLILGALAGCAPVPHVECGGDGCTSSIAEVTAWVGEAK
ncbi:MAG: hypothetical protein ACK4NW_02140 [Roseinatronobacter sp.]